MTAIVQRLRNLRYEKEKRTDWWEHREFVSSEQYTDKQEILPHKEAYNMGAACSW